MIVTGAVAAVLAMVGGAGLFGVHQGNAALRHVFEGRAQTLQAISTVNELITQINFALGDAMLDPSAQKTASVVKVTGQRIESIDARLGRGDTRSLMHAMSLMRTQLASMVGNIKRSTETIGVAAAEITEGNHALSARTEQHAASLQQTSATMEQIASTVRANADPCEPRADGGARGVGTREGRRTRRRRCGRAHDRSVVALIADRLYHRGHRIDRVPDQSARAECSGRSGAAGSLGRGFAVVAEVRSLAYRSSGAAKEISQLTREVNTQVASGGDTVKRAGATLVALMTSVDDVSALIDAIATASREAEHGYRRSERRGFADGSRDAAERGAGARCRIRRVIARCAGARAEGDGAGVRCLRRSTIPVTASAPDRAKPLRPDILFDRPS